MNVFMKKKNNLYPLIDPTENFRAAWQIVRSTLAGGEKGGKGKKELKICPKAVKVLGFPLL